MQEQLVRKAHQKEAIEVREKREEREGIRKREEKERK